MKFYEFGCAPQAALDGYAYGESVFGTASEVEAMFPSGDFAAVRGATLFDDESRNEWYVMRKLPVKHLICCCCGKHSKGRQWRNQDIGFGLGSCCADYVSSRVDDVDAIYGRRGVHYDLKEEV